MKFKLVIILLLSLMSDLAVAQTQGDQNLDKYWYYRYRLRHQFLKAGLEPYGCVDPQSEKIASGYSIPAMEIRDLGNFLNWGDGTVNLGWYIGVLATEYQLLKKQGQSTEKTREELYYAMKAYERLDWHAEKINKPYVNMCNDGINGFFCRDDVDSVFAEKYFPGQAFMSEYVAHKRPFPFSNDRGGEESQDQVDFLLLGFALVIKSVEPGINYNGYDFNSHAVLYTRLMMKYIAMGGGSINFFQGISGLGQYTIPIPYTEPREYVQAHASIEPAVEFAYGFARAATALDPQTGSTYNNDASSVHLRFWQDYQMAEGLALLIQKYNNEGESFYCALVENLASIGNSWEFGFSVSQTKKRIWLSFLPPIPIDVNIYCYQMPLALLPPMPNDPGEPINHTILTNLAGLSVNSMPIPVFCAPFYLPPLTINTTGEALSYMGKLFHNEYYALQYEYLHGGQNFISDDFYKQEINSAPCRGPHFSPSLGDNGVPGWRTVNRFEKSRYRNGVTTANKGNEGKFNGLDYMLLYNLFGLVNGTGGEGTDAFYINKLHVDINGNIPYSYNGVQYGTATNPLNVKAFEDIEYSGNINAGANVTFHAGDFVDIAPGSNIAYGSNFNTVSTPLECNSTGTGYQKVAANVKPVKEAPVDTAALAKDYVERITAKLKDEVARKTPEINAAMDKYRYIPAEQYIAEKNKEVSKTSFNLFPNPASSTITIEISLASESSVEVTISDIYGKVVLAPVNNVVFKKGYSRTAFDISLLPDGTYFYSIKTDAKAEIGKFIKRN